MAGRIWTKEEWEEHVKRVKKSERLIPLSVLEDIKAEINEEKELAYADFERYKVECLGQEQEDVCDSLPQDDYRYGMERCIDIINKHLGE